LCTLKNGYNGEYPLYIGINQLISLYMLSMTITLIESSFRVCSRTKHLTCKLFISDFSFLCFLVWWLPFFWRLHVLYVYICCHWCFFITYYAITCVSALLCFLLLVRIYGLKREGGELFKKDFQKLLSLQWKYFKKTLIKKSVFPKHKAKAQYWKNNRLFYWNNRLFIPVIK